MPKLRDFKRREGNDVSLKLMLLKFELMSEIMRLRKYKFLKSNLMTFKKHTHIINYLKNILHSKIKFKYINVIEININMISSMIMLTR